MRLFGSFLKGTEKENAQCTANQRHDLRDGHLFLYMPKCHYAEGQDTCTDGQGITEAAHVILGQNPHTRIKKQVTDRQGSDLADEYIFP